MTPRADDKPTPPIDDGFAPPPPADAAPRKRRFGLGSIMVAVVYIAILLAIGRDLARAETDLQFVSLSLLLGLGVAAIGFWAAGRLVRYGGFGWVLVIFGVGVMMAGTIRLLAIPIVPVLIGSVVYGLRRRRASQQDGLLATLAAAVDRGVPLAPAVRAHAEQARGIDRLWAEGLARLLDEGMPLPDAVDSVPRLLPAEARALVRAGWESGRLGPAINEAVAARRRREPALRDFNGRVAYLLWVFCFSETVFGFLVYFITPKLEAIFQDFGLALPRPTALLTGMGRVAGAYGGYIAAAELVVGIYALFALASGSTPRVPLLDRAFRGRHRALILRLLAVPAGAGRPLGPSLARLAEWYPTGWVGRNIDDARRYAEGGVDPIEALAGCDLITAADRGVLDAARGAGNLAWALAELADAADRRAGERLGVISQVLFVATILLLGGIAFLIALGCVAPLIRLIEGLSA